MKLSQVLTAPNQLTLLRMIFVPFIVIHLVEGHYLWALVVFVIAGFSDGLDGLLARTLHQQTLLGQYLDPIADKILLSGYIGDHGITILSQRENLEFEADLSSDCAALNGLVDAMLDEVKGAGSANAIRCMRDPTRGGVASVLNEIAGRSRVGMVLEEDTIPVRDTVRGACEMLGLDPLYVANEGKLVAIVSAEIAARVLDRMKNHPLGKESRMIGQVLETPAGMVLMKTSVGGTRVVDTLFGEQLPRIC